MEIECIVSGKVQGVGYRDYVANAATACHVSGYIQNRSDGTVLVCAQGAQPDLKDFIEYLHEGSVMAVTDDVGVTWRSAEKVYDDFSVAY